MNDHVPARATISARVITQHKSIGWTMNLCRTNGNPRGGDVLLLEWFSARWPTW